MTRVVRCGRCGLAGECEPINGLVPDLPPRWGVIAFHVQPMESMILCPSCLRTVREAVKP